MSAVADQPPGKIKWPIKPLGEVCKLLNGRAYKQPELLPEGKYRVLRVGNFFTNKNWYFSDLELPPEKYCDHGDLLYAWSASFGPRIWEGEKVIYHYHIWRVDFDPQEVVRDFLFYFFQWDVEKIKKEQGAGTTMIHVTKGAMEKRLLAVPPLPEQERIVAILDEAFEGIATATAHAERNLHNARELFQSVLQSTFEQKGEDWVESGESLDKLCDLIIDCEHKTAPTQDSGIPSIRTPNIGRGDLILEGVKRVSEETYKGWTRRGEPRPGDLILAREAPAGNIAVIPENERVLIVDLAWWRVKKSGNF